MNLCKFCEHFLRSMAKVINKNDDNGVCEKLNPRGDDMTPEPRNLIAQGRFVLVDENFGCVNFIKREGKK